MCWLFYANRIFIMRKSRGVARQGLCGQHVTKALKFMAQQHRPDVCLHSAQIGVMPQSGFERARNAGLFRINLPWVQIDDNAFTVMLFKSAESQPGVRGRKDAKISSARDRKIGP